MAVDVADFDKAARAFQQIAADGLALPMAEHLIDVWTKFSQADAPVDTGQLRARINTTYIGGDGTRAEATNHADVPYAGFVEFGTRYMDPQPYWRPGMEEAQRLAESAGGSIAAEIARSIESGGVWNPRSVFGL